MQRINTLYAKGVIHYAHQDFDHYILIIEDRDENNFPSLLMIKLDHGFCVEDIIDIDHPNFETIDIAKHIVTRSDDTIYLGQMVGENGEKSFIEIKNYKLQIAEYPDTQMFKKLKNDIENFQSKVEDQHFKNMKINLVKNVNETKYIIGELYTKENNYIGAFYMKYDMLKDNIICEKIYNADEYKYNFKNLLITKDKDVVLYGNKVMENGERQIFIDRFFDCY